MEILPVSILSKQLHAKAKNEERRWQTWSVFSQCKGQEGRRALEGLVQVQEGREDHTQSGHATLSYHSEYHSDDVQGTRMECGIAPASLLVLLNMPKEVKERWTPAPYPT